MTDKNFKNNLSQPIFPEESGLIIEKILEKYELEKEQEEGIQRFFDSQIPENRKEIFENLPGFKISKLLKECAYGEFSLEELSQKLEEVLNISPKEAKQIKDDLQKGILDFIKWEVTSGEKAGETIIDRGTITELGEEEMEEIGAKEEQRPAVKDTYREPIE